MSFHTGWVKTSSALVEHKISASHPKPDIRAAATIKARWICEQGTSN
jgi:hypothetical protein